MQFQVVPSLLDNRNKPESPSNQFSTTYSNRMVDVAILGFVVILILRRVIVLSGSEDGANRFEVRSSVQLVK
jgi:hypothetical protein